MHKRLALLILLFSFQAFAAKPTQALSFTLEINQLILHYHSQSLYHGALGLGWCTSFEWPCKAEPTEAQKKSIQEKLSFFFSFERDELHLTQIKTAENTVRFQYDEVSNLSAMRSLKTQRNFFYSKNDELIQTTVEALSGGLQ